jgi:hypothetical protein
MPPACPECGRPVEASVLADLGACIACTTTPPPDDDPDPEPPAVAAPRTLEALPEEEQREYNDWADQEARRLAPAAIACVRCGQTATGESNMGPLCDACIAKRERDRQDRARNRALAKARTSIDTAKRTAVAERRRRESAPPASANPPAFSLYK